LRAKIYRCPLWKQFQRAFLAAAGRLIDPMLIIYGADTPALSKAEIQALIRLPNVQSHELPAGKLSVHEEFPTPVAELVRAFIS
jgi:pimeloyl-ACP methyl ester carboxylesterase